MPRASPLTTVTPREPTTATASASSRTSVPRTYSGSGASGMSRSCAGYSSSCRAIRRIAPRAPPNVSLWIHSFIRQSGALSAETLRRGNSFQYTGPRVSVKDAARGRLAPRSACGAAGSPRRRQQRARLVRRTRPGIVLDHLLADLAGVRVILERAITQPDLEQRLGDQRALRVAIDGPPELHQSLAEIALPIVRLADPVLGVGRERMLRELLRQ